MEYTKKEIMMLCPRVGRSGDAKKGQKRQNHRITNNRLRKSR